MGQFALNIHNVLRAINKGENEITEFKLKPTPNRSIIYRDICAFANSKGGIIIFGVSYSGDIIGCNLRSLKSLAAKINKEIILERLFPPSIEAELKLFEIDNKRILCISVKKSANKIDYKGIVYCRINGMTVALDTAKAYKSINRSGVYNCLLHSSRISSDEAAFRILEPFKEWVEEHKGWQTILNLPEKTREKEIQRLIDLKGREYCETNNIDMSFEPNEGPGPVDLKLSRGNDKTVIEIKLSTNSQYLHGFSTQIEEYARAEKTNKKIYVYIDVGNPIRTDRLIELQKKMKEEGKDPAHLFIIDSKEKKSASKK